MKEGDRTVDTNEMAGVLDVEPRFVRRYLYEAHKKEKLPVTMKPGKGKLKFADPIQFADYLRRRGFVEAADKLVGHYQR